MKDNLKRFAGDFAAINARNGRSDSSNLLRRERRGFEFVTHAFQQPLGKLESLSQGKPEELCWGT